MKKSQVYFTDMRVHDEGLAEKLVSLAKRAGIENIDFTGKFVAIKVHFGEMGNLSAKEIGLGWEVKAQLIVDGKFVYDCSLYVESDGGAAFAGTLLPGAWKEMIAAAEVPEGVMDAAQSAQFVFTSGENSFAYDIIG